MPTPITLHFLLLLLVPAAAAISPNHLRRRNLIHRHLQSLSSPSPSPSPLRISSTSSHSHIFHATDFGADPTGSTDSSTALSAALLAAASFSHLFLTPSIPNLGGAELHLDGGTYLISSPLSLPFSGAGNLKIHSGSLLAAGTFPPDRYLIELNRSISIPTLATNRHIMTIPSTVPRPAGFTWDPTAQHFVVGSSSGPIISSISDAGVAETIVSDSLTSEVSSISVDNPRRRLLVSLRNPNTLAAYDLRSPRPHRRIFSSSLPASPGGIAVDPVSGFVFVSGADTGVIWRVDLEGIVSDFSKSAIYGDEGLVGVAHVRKGFLLVIQRNMGRIFKVDDENGAAKEVIGMNWRTTPETQGVAVLVDGTAVVAGRSGVRMLQSRDGWAEAAVKGEVKVEEGKKFKGVTVREGKRAYVLVTPAKEEEGDDLGSRIEEVEWEEEGDLLWLMVLVGFGLAYFLYWRFQMRQLVSNMNKKRA